MMLKGAKPVPIVKDVVLLGGGHTHLEVLRSFGMHRVPGVQLTLISRDIQSPYSGMLPGYVSGFYSHDECHVDLGVMSQYANARLIHAPATGIDIKRRAILFADRPPIPYDVLSINIGIAPSLEALPGARAHCTPVKPIDSFVARFDALLLRVEQRAGPLTVAVVGGGAAGVELTLALHHRLTNLATSDPIARPSPAPQKSTDGAAGPPTAAVQIVLVSSGDVLPSHNRYARNALTALLQERGIQLRRGAAVRSVEAGALLLAGGERLPFDECLLCTPGAAAGWLADTGLPTTETGFLKINEFLQVDGGPAEVFAAGDVATSTPYPRPKAGVYAVRQGPPLADNLRRLLTGQPLKAFKPQTTALSLIATGSRHAVGSKWILGVAGDWVWRWKDRLDREWMAKYTVMLREDLRTMAEQADAAGTPPSIAAAGPEAAACFAASRMRCGGCGAKVGATVLTRVLAQLRETLGDGPFGGEGVIQGVGDDAAVVRPPPPGRLQVQTVDFLQGFVADPLEFGAITAVHCLSDCHAMGATAHSALAVAVVPFATEAHTEALLLQMMTGAVKALAADGCALVGGHTVEGAQLALGFAVTGSVEEGGVLGKGGLQPGNVLLLTKALGTGTIMAASMRGQTSGEHVRSATHSMLQSNADAAECLRQHGATGCTDVTGFGLLGHLAEMTRASGTAAVVDLAQVPLLEGAEACLEAGVTSSLHADNARAVAVVTNPEALTGARGQALMDPQTAGGLLASLPKERGEACVAALRGMGYERSVVVGEVVAADREAAAGLGGAMISIRRA